ncbi:MAG TPA: hypothetical protein VE135_12230 [Pyrinomonadaceae bacterium]|nr:hypothetical protein [Pyrinomonadaceae bacterium]
MKRRIERSRERCERAEEDQKKGNKELPRDHGRSGAGAKSDSSNAFTQPAPVLQS